MTLLKTKPRAQDLSRVLAQLPAPIRAQVEERLAENAARIADLERQVAALPPSSGRPGETADPSARGPSLRHSGGAHGDRMGLPASFAKTRFGMAGLRRVS